MQYQLSLLMYVTVPIPTFILGPCDESQYGFYSSVSSSGGDLCDNLTFLGKEMHDSWLLIIWQLLQFLCCCPVLSGAGRSGVYTSAQKLTIAYLSGVNGSGASSDGDEVVRVCVCMCACVCVRVQGLNFRSFCSSEHHPRIV